MKNSKKSEVKLSSGRSENEFNQIEQQQEGTGEYWVEKKYQSLLQGENREQMEKDMREQEKVVRQMGEAMELKVKTLIQQKVENCLQLLRNRQQVVNGTDKHLLELFSLGLPCDQLATRLQNDQEPNNLVQLARVYLQEFTTIDRQLHYLFQDISTPAQQPLEHITTHRQLNNYKQRLCSFYIAGDLQQIQEVRQLEVEQAKGYTPLMKLTGDQLHYHSSYWTNGQSTPFQPFLPLEFDHCIIRPELATLPVQYIKLEVVDPLTHQTRYSLLKKQHCRPLVEDFRQDKMQVLQYVEGCRNPLELMLGIDYVNVRVMQPYWRLNGCYTKREDKGKGVYGEPKSIYMRIGSFFSRKKTHYQKDKQGHECSLDAVGIGITDYISYHSTLNQRSAGIRMWNDQQSLGDLQGQLFANLNIYAK